MEQTRQQIRDTLAAHAPVRVEMDEDIKASQDKLDADRGKRRADMEAFN
jgi:hypothetical protein